MRDTSASSLKKVKRVNEKILPCEHFVPCLSYSGFNFLMLILKLYITFMSSYHEMVFKTMKNWVEGIKGRLLNKKLMSLLNVR